VILCTEDSIGCAGDIPAKGWPYDDLGACDSDTDCPSGWKPSPTDNLSYTNQWNWTTGDTENSDDHDGSGWTYSQFINCQEGMINLDETNWDNASTPTPPFSTADCESALSQYSSGQKWEEHQNFKCAFDDNGENGRCVFNNTDEPAGQQLLHPSKWGACASSIGLFENQSQIDSSDLSGIFSETTPDPNNTDANDRTYSSEHEESYSDHGWPIYKHYNYSVRMWAVNNKYDNRQAIGGTKESQNCERHLDNPSYLHDWRYDGYANIVYESGGTTNSQYHKSILMVIMD
jgi:hypothetical protein